MRPIEELRYLILAAQREGSRTFSEIMRPLGLTPSQSEVLRVLYQYEPLSLAELGQLLVCETGSPSRLVNRLVESDHIELRASKEDMRKVKLTLTDKGREAVASIIMAEEQVYEALEPLLLSAPVDQMMQLLWRLVEGKPAGNALALRKSSEKRSEG